MCTGWLVLAPAAILRHRRAGGSLRRLGAKVVTERVVFDGKIATAARVSAGVDLAHTLAARLTTEETARGLQLAIESVPQLPFESGSQEAAAPVIVPVTRHFVASRGGNKDDHRAETRHFRAVITEEGDLTNL